MLAKLNCCQAERPPSGGQGVEATPPFDSAQGDIIKVFSYLTTFTQIRHVGP